MDVEMNEQDALYKLVEQFATAEQVTELLRSSKGSEGVRVTAENKTDLVHRNLRGAVESRAISIEKVYDLLCGVTPLALGLFPTRLVYMGMAVGFAEVELGTTLGAWLYREETA